jgi:hypothetical protein
MQRTGGKPPLKEAFGSPCGRFGHTNQYKTQNYENCVPILLRNKTGGTRKMGALSL